MSSSASYARRQASTLLSLRAVLGFRGGLRGAPPGLVGAVPLDGGGKAGGEVVVRRTPAQLAAQLGAVDGVAAVVAGAVAHPVEVVLRAAERPQNPAQHGEVVALAVGADQVRLAHAAARQDRPHGRRVILGVNPVAHVAPVAVELGAHAVDEVRDLARNEQPV